MKNRVIFSPKGIVAKSPAIAEPPVKIKPAIDMQVLAALDEELQDNSYVYVHCYLDNPGTDLLIRVWKTTYLVDSSTGTRSKLVHAENVSFAPMWTMVPDGVNFNFLLIFSALPKSSTGFDLVEDVPTSGGFFVPGIQRNMTDVYHINMS